VRVDGCGSPLLQGSSIQQVGPKGCSRCCRVCWEGGRDYGQAAQQWQYLCSCPVSTMRHTLHAAIAQPEGAGGVQGKCIIPWGMLWQDLHHMMSQHAHCTLLTAHCTLHIGHCMLHAAGRQLHPGQAHHPRVRAVGQRGPHLGDAGGSAAQVGWAAWVELLEPQPRPFDLAAQFVIYAV